MRITVLGGTGTAGQVLSTEFESRGHDVVRASRSTGVDALTGDGLAASFEGSEFVVDCLDVKTSSRRKAKEFFSVTTGNVLDAAQAAGVRRIGCLSVAQAWNPQTSRVFGYLQGKFLQEEHYNAAPIATTVLRSTQWFESVEELLRRVRPASSPVVPKLLVDPVSLTAAMRFFADLMEADLGNEHVHAVRGPEIATLLEFAQRIAAARGEDGLEKVRELPLLGLPLAEGVLVPTDSALDKVTLEDWLAERSPVAA